MIYRLAVTQNILPLWRHPLNYPVPVMKSIRGYNIKSVVCKVAFALFLIQYQPFGILHCALFAHYVATIVTQMHKI